MTDLINQYTKSRPVFIIAEAGVNHNGNAELAIEMIDVASRSGADAIKFQTFKSENVISRFAPKAGYQKKTIDDNESQLEMIQQLELTVSDHQKLSAYCSQKKIHFLSSAFDLGSIDVLDELGLKLFKIPSGEITNLPYLRKIGALKKKLILSTGMAAMQEIKAALLVLESAGTGRENIILLHCTTEYPAPFEAVNLKAMLTLKTAFDMRVGLSDHTVGIEIPPAAVAMGACVIEKHFTLDKSMNGPDHQASLNPEELKNMVSAIRNVEMALGDGQKAPTPSELLNRDIVRKSIVAARDIKADEAYTAENLCVKRPGTGINPMRWDDIIGKKAPGVFKEDELIRLE